MTVEMSAKENDLIRLDGKGMTATIKIGPKEATVMHLEIPEELLGTEEGGEVLSEIENAAAEEGAEKLVYEFPEEEALSAFFLKNGYDLAHVGEMLSFSVTDLLDSEAVKKTLRMNIPGVKSAAFEELFAFQRDDVVEFLKKTSFSIQGEDFDRYNPLLSIVSYDESYHHRGLILTTDWEEGHLVELLIGFSKSKPQYTLGVCQEFVRVLSETTRVKDHKRIYVYSCADFVKALILRFLDKKYELKKEYTVMRVQKAINTTEEPVFRDFTVEDPEKVWREEADRVMGRRNISEKSFWYSNRNPMT